jgi:hypothetical protein
MEFTILTTEFASVPTIIGLFKTFDVDVENVILFKLIYDVLEMKNNGAEFIKVLLQPL